MNVECGEEVRDEIETAFRFNDAVIRNLILKRDEAITDMSILAKAKSEEDAAEKKTAAERAANAKREAAAQEAKAKAEASTDKSEAADAAPAE